MKRSLRLLLFLTALLAVPVVPFLFFGAAIDRWVENWQGEPAAAGFTALVVVVMLSTDVLLPIPSSVISTIGGMRLGPFWGTLASWFGMSLAALIGFALARKWGRPVALRFSRDEELTRMQNANERFGMWLLVITRAIPVLAEATVLLMGIQRMPWRSFVPPVLLSNLGIALAYSAFGHIAGRYLWLPALLAIAVALPLLLAAFTSRILQHRHDRIP